MFGLKDRLHGLRMCLNHSQSGVEQAAGEVGVAFHRWQLHPGNTHIQTRLLADLENLRWLIEQHFRQVMEGDTLRQAVGTSHDIEHHYVEMVRWQNQLLSDLQSMLRQVGDSRDQSGEISKLARQFESFQQAMRCEEAEERQLVESTLHFDA